MVRVRSWILSGFALLPSVVLPSAAQAQPPLMHVAWEQVEYGDYIGGAGLWCLDLDRDGTEEILIGSNRFPNRMFAVLQRLENEYVPRWVSPWHEWNPIRRLLPWAGPDGAWQIYAFLSNDQVEVYDGATLALLRTLPLPTQSASDFELANLDEDPGLEVVITGPTFVRIFDLETQVLQVERTDLGGSDVALGDVDVDGAVEIVLNTGHVLDATTLNEEWGYIGGFGELVQLGNIDADPAPEIVAMGGAYYIRAFDAQDRSPLWQIDTGSDHDALLLADVAGDARDEILLGNGQWGAIHCYDATTQKELWSIPNPEHGVTQIAVGDPDADGSLEVLWGAGQTSTGADRLYVGGTESHQIEWSSLDLDGPFLVAAQDLDGDGRAEIIEAAAESNSGYDPGKILIRDAETHALEWTLAPAVYGEVGCVAGVGPTADRLGCVVYGVGNTVRAVDAGTHQEIWSATLSGTVLVLQVQDVDNDGVPEIVAGEATGRLYVFDGNTFAEEWRSIDTGEAVEGIALANVDSDPALEIVFFGLNGIVQIYDGSRHTLQWQSSNLSNVTSIAVGDYNLDGVPEIAAGQSDGGVSVLESGTFAVLDTLQAATGPVRSLAFANLDAATGRELLVGDSQLRVLDLGSHIRRWTSADLRGDVGRYGSLAVLDIDADGSMDVVAGSAWGAFQFTASERYPDITPPRVTAAFPVPGLDFVGRDTPIRAEFSEALDTGTVSIQNIRVDAADTPVTDGELQFDPERNELSFTPRELLPAGVTVRVTLGGGLRDGAGNGLDSNGNGIGDGSPVDDFTWSFHTGTGTDEVGPRIVEASSNVDSVWAGIPVEISAAISDSSAVAITGVRGGEAFVDQVGDPGTGVPLEPVDGAFDSAFERVRATISTVDWTQGEHTLHLRGEDVGGNWGEAAQIRIFGLRPDASNWSMFGCDPQHTGVNPASRIPRTLEFDWSISVGTGSVSQVGTANGLVYAVSSAYFGESKIVAVRAEDGSRVWSRTVSNVFSVNPASFAYGNVYFTSCNHSTDTWLWAVDALTGELHWRSPFAAQWEKYLSPTIAEGRVFIDGGSYGGMYGFDALGGEPLWFLNLAQYDQWTPAYHQGVLYVFVGGTLTAVAAGTGQVLWSKDDVPFDWAGYSMGTAPVVDATHGIVLTTSHSYLHAISLTSHEILWSKTGTLGVNPAVHDAKVYAVRNGGLEVYDITTGQPAWMNTDHAYNQPPIIANGLVFVAGADGTWALDEATHQEVFSYGVGGQISVGGDRLYIGTADGRLLSLQPQITPVFLRDFEIETTPDGVRFAWRVRDGGEVGQFRLVGSCADARWEVPYTLERAGEYRAIDSRHACTPNPSYSLYHSGEGSDWVLLATRQVGSDIPKVLTLAQNGPNPFRGFTSFRYGLPHPTPVRLAIYDVRGKRVALLVEQPQPAGYRSVTWDGRDARGAAVASGVYFARLETPAGIRNQRLVLAK